MDEFLNDESVQQIIERIKYRTALCLQRQSDRSAVPTGTKITEQDWNDVYAREVLKDPALRTEVRVNILVNLVQASPGGILAMAWLCEVASNRITPDMIRNFSLELFRSDLYATKLTRSASRKTLDEKECIYCLDCFMSTNGLSEDDRLAVLMCFLKCDCISEAARSKSLIYCSENHSWGLGDAVNKLILWAIGYIGISELRGRLGFLTEIPESPAFLARPAIVEYARLGKDITKLVRYIIQKLVSSEEKKASLNDDRYILHAFLDLTEDNHIKLDGTIFSICVRSNDASVRRRAYSLAAANKSFMNTEEGKKLFSSAMKDKDVNIRNWAVNRSRSDSKSR